MQRKFNLLILLSIITSLIALILFLAINVMAATNLTFTAHPTNVAMGSQNFAPQKEIDYYYDKHLSNLAEILLYDANNYLQDIGQFYSWIGYDFDRSNLNAKNIVYANIKGINMLLDIYDNYNRKWLNDDSVFSNLLEKIRYYVKSVKLLILDQELQTAQFIQKFSDIADDFNLSKVERDITERLKVINFSADLTKKPFITKLLKYFAKFKFQAFKGQVRLDGNTLNSEIQYHDIFEIVKNINQIQDYAISDIIISNFSSIEQIKIIKKIKSSYNLSNISTIPLLETEEDVDYAINNIEQILAIDNISQIMKAGSDDTKFSGLATSIINLAKLGYAIQETSHQKPILFLGMGSSTERLGGPVFFRKMLANIMGDNETNRTIQGGELESLASKESILKKLKNEIDISKTRTYITPDNAQETKHLSYVIKNSLAKEYQELHSSKIKRDSLNEIIADATNLAYLLDNYQAGSRYKRKITINIDSNAINNSALNSNALTNNFVDVFNNTRAINFQTIFALSGIHPEFTPYAYLTFKQINDLLLFKDNRIIKTYLTGMCILSKQMNPDFYLALDLPKSSKFYKDYTKGIKIFAKIIKENLTNLCDKTEQNLINEKYLDYSDKTQQEIRQNLATAKVIINQYHNNQLSFKELNNKLLDINHKIAILRNLLSLKIKN